MAVASAPNATYSRGTPTERAVDGDLPAGTYTFSVRWRTERDGYTVNGQMTSGRIDVAVDTGPPGRPRNFSAKAAGNWQSDEVASGDR